MDGVQDGPQYLAERPGDRRRTGLYFELINGSFKVSHVEADKRMKKHISDIYFHFFPACLFCVWQ